MTFAALLAICALVDPNTMLVTDKYTICANRARLGPLRCRSCRTAGVTRPFMAEKAGLVVVGVVVAASVVGEGVAAVWFGSG